LGHYQKITWRQNGQHDALPGNYLLVACSLVLLSYVVSGGT
jgi:hypothetical protein